MRQFKVESISIKKEFMSIIIEANNRSEALEKARAMKIEDFDHREKAEQFEWSAKSDRSFYNMLLSLFEGKA